MNATTYMEILEYILIQSVREVILIPLTALESKRYGYTRCSGLLRNNLPTQSNNLTLLSGRTNLLPSNIQLLRVQVT